MLVVDDGGGDPAPSEPVAVEAPPPAPPPPPPPPPSQPPAESAPDVRSYSGGWCTAYVASRAPWIPPGMGDAWHWIDGAEAAGLFLTDTPTAGSVVVYGKGGGYSELGHVAFVERVFSRSSFEVSEMAYVAWNRVDTRTSNMQDVAGFILPPGVDAGAGLATAPPPPPQGLDGARQAWERLMRGFDRGVPDLLNEWGQVNAALRGLN